MKNLYIPLESRSVLCIEGADSHKFLQGIITNDVEKINEHKAIYSLTLTPQGKFLFELFISQIDGKIYIDCVSKYKNELIKLLARYKLRSDVVISDVDDEYEVLAVIGDKILEAIEHKEGIIKDFCKGVAFIDPRSKAMYVRVIIEKGNRDFCFGNPGFECGNCDDYQRLRVLNNIPDGEFDMQYEKSFPMQYNMENLHAIDFEKGCYVGQEVTARSKYRGNIKKSVYLIAHQCDDIEYGDEVVLEGQMVGKALSHHGKMALALLNNEIVEKNLDKDTLKVHDTPITILNVQ